MKLLLQILLIFLIISTISICISKPDMHKTVMVYDSAYTLIPEKHTEVETETIPIMQKVIEPAKTEHKIEPIVTTEVKQIPRTETKQIDTKIQTQPTVTKSSTVIPKAKVVNTVKTTDSKLNPTTQQTTVKYQPATQKQENKIETIQTNKVVSEPKKVVLTQQEEIIAWNIWRSNLQNKIMQDTKLPMLPTGVIFKFSFTVDKYGKISNLQTWSETPTYTPYAIQYIAPVIRNYQGRAILNFPEGTARTVTDVKGGWKISVNEKYSTPQDYNDIEKIKK